MHNSKALGGKGECLSDGSLGESYQELIFTSDSAGCCLGHILMAKASIILRPLQNHTEWMLQYYGIV